MPSSILARGRLAVISANLFASTEKSSDAILGTSAVSAAQPQPNVKGSLTIVDERTGKSYQVQVSNEGTLKATDFKKVVAITVFCLLVVAFYAFFAPFLGGRIWEYASIATYTPVVYVVLRIYMDASWASD